MGEILSNPTIYPDAGGRISLRRALLSRLEHVPLFVDGIERDLISDLTTRVVFDVLAEFTADLMTRFPTLAVGSSSAAYPVWDSDLSALSERPLSLPSVDGSPLLLVPKGWVYWRLVMDPDAFYNRYSTQFIQDRQTTYDAEGKPVKPRKKNIQDDNRDRKATNVRESLQCANLHSRNLPAEYEAEIDNTFEPLSDDGISSRIVGEATRKVD